jgi:peptidoglycan-associated lipoprotein
MQGDARQKPAKLKGRGLVSDLLRYAAKNGSYQVNPKINIVKWASLAVTFSACLTGCAKKVRPPVEESVTREGFPTDQPRTVPNVSEEDLRRQRIMAEAKEVFQTIYYPLDQSTLDVKAKSILTAVSRFMKEHNEVSVTVAGHCDERGTEEYNIALGEQRARAVTRYLADLGVPESRMKTLSYGEERPASEGHSETSWALNRRAEFSPEYRFEVSGTGP